MAIQSYPAATALSVTPIAAAAAPTASLRIKDWSYNKSGSFVEFAIVVHDFNKSAYKHPNVYIVRNRFSQFSTLHKSLRASGFAVPDMPTVDLWTNVLIALTPGPILAQRQKQLQHFLDCVSQSAAMQATAAFKVFAQSNKAPLGYVSLKDVRIHPMGNATVSSPARLGNAVA
ncbi:Aste57867_517 [Aphanomyces stellatus]|uniref:Aste57867_517 protein n=1 Tax=Aphanomyces stellatus TaxID=120398 RepID=A0A485K5H4_9STRA|nr:hypothetical protein As57867_000516 [Aphanomyces stellatus]VFT77742.1 Aste57867_517 [Aphanomyces stellatus]